MGFLSWFRSALNPRHSPCRRSRYEEMPVGEILEFRIVPASSSDLTPTLIHFSPTAPGEKTSVETAIQNLGAVGVKAVRVEYRLSSDSTIDAQDLVLKTVTRRRLAAGDNSQWDQKLTLPADLPAGRYFLGIVVDPQRKVAETNEANNVLATDTSVAVFPGSLTGQVTVGGSKRPVTIVGLNGTDIPIDPTVTTWIVIHGRNQSAQSPNLVELARIIDEFQQGDRVLLLDWSKAAASGDLGGNGENFIKPVANWAANALQSHGFGGTRINLVGYSWGSYVAAEMAEVVGSVNSILSIEAARDYPGGTYNPEAPGEVNFAAHADQSWAFFDMADLFGSALTAATAEESFLTQGSDHFKAVSLGSDILNPPQAGPLAPAISLERLLNGLPAPLWQDKYYDATGKLVDAGAGFSAVVQATPDGEHAESLRYFDGENERTIAV